jgi:hypothetical protein
MTGPVQIEAFWRRWRHEPDDAAEFAKLRTRAEHVVKEKIWRVVYASADFWKELALFFGSKHDETDVAYPGFALTSLSRALVNARNPFELVQTLQCTLWAVAKVFPDLLETCIGSLNGVFVLSPTLLIHAARSPEGATIYPGGAGLLDETLIQENLVWLADHRNTLKSFQQALAIYLSKDTDKYRNLLDNLRFAVEQLLKDVLGNQKSLENQKDTLLPWMKRRDLHPHVSGMYHDLLFKHFALYQNDAVKHGERYAPEEIEFMIYLTGTFMRLLIQLSKQGQGEPS